MVIIDTFYHLIERDTPTVTIHWKALQVIGFITASVSAFASAIWFYNMLDGFSMNCILYPEIVFKALSPGHVHFNILPNNTTIDGVTTIWSRDIICQYSMCVWMISFVSGAILATFFIVSPKGGKGYHHSPFNQPWKMVFPMTLISVLMCVLTGAAVINTASGINAFCASFENYTQSKICSNAIDIYTLKYNEEKQPFNMSRRIVKGCASLTWIAWTFCVIILVTRICLAPDFQLQVMNIKPQRKSGEKRKVLYSVPSFTVLQKHRHLRIEQLPVEENTKSTQKSSDDGSEINYV